LRPPDRHAGLENSVHEVKKHPAQEGFKTAKERLGLWPLTVWDCDPHNPRTRSLKTQIGDKGQARDGCFSGGPDSLYSGKVRASIFNPSVAEWILNCFALGKSRCFDPFAGGGTRAIMAARAGLAYTGIELRRKEARAALARCKRLGVADRVRIRVADAQDCSHVIESASCDFLLTCPPYWNLERYKGGASDLSMCSTYEGYLAGIRRVVAETFRILAPGAVSCWVVGLHRNPSGSLKGIHHDIAAIHTDLGFRFREEIILAHRNNGAVRRVGNFDKGKRLLVRTHEYVLIFNR